MEINKDEALRCLKIAKNQYGSKNFEAAVRLTKKSLNLFPTDDAKAFLEKAEIAAKETPSTPKQDEPQQQQQAQQQKEKPKSSGEQSKEVREILACGSDYYKVLKLEKKCTEVEIKKSYRKLALKFHPDKNKTAGADEAFKLISKAFTVLSDPQKRAVHDAGGGDPEQRGNAGFSGFRGQNFGASPFGEEISPEDLFNMFFGGGGMARGGSFSFGGPPGFSSATFVGPGFRTHTFNTGRRAPPPSRQTTNSGWSIFLQILPLILLFGYTLFSGLFVDDMPHFSFQSTSVYSQTRVTSAHQVPYYVNPNSFRSVEQSSYKLAKMEQQVETDWVRSLQHSCQQERRRKSQLLNNARGVFGIGRNEKLYEEAQKTKLPSCDEIRRVGYHVDY